MCSDQVETSVEWSALERAVKTLVLLMGWSFMAAAAGPAHRVALLAGVNDGGPGRPRLRFAASDAQAFGAVMRELGGLAERDTVMVVDGDRARVLSGLDQLAGLARRARGAGDRVEAIVYYSGHSDEQGLLLRGERLDYTDLRGALGRVDADVKVVVLDSCASGALARKKGFVRRPPFLDDESARVHGTAILTSSAEDEVSQESERLRGSFFTHHLVSALRGAADADGDGRITLGEAYDLAYRETLARTESTQGGAQHATYDMDLTGTGGLVLTDLRTGSAGLVLDAALEGRIFVRDSSGALAAEVAKRPGARVELGLPPGRYSVRREWQEGSALADITLRDGERRTLDVKDFSRATVEATTPRGDGPSLRVVPVNLGLFPTFSTNDLLPEAAENNFALGLVTRSAALHGAALGFFWTWVDQESRYFQGSLGVNLARSSVTGVQLAPVMNWSGGTVTGVQIPAFVNRAESDLRGAQLSIATGWVGGSVRGFQFGGMFGYAGTDSAGAQMSLALNIARSGWTGAQLGAVNLAHKVTGVQLGLVNVADEMDGVPFGLVNVIGNGQRHVEAYADDVEPVNVSLKTGSRAFYTGFVVGGGWLGTFRYGVGAGLHLDLGQSFWTDFDVGASSVYPVVMPLAFTNVLAQGRVVFGWRVVGPVSLFGGVSANTYLRFNSDALAGVSWLPTLFSLNGGNILVWPGFVAGVRL